MLQLRAAQSKVLLANVYCVVVVYSGFYDIKKRKKLLFLCLYARSIWV